MTSKKEYKKLKYERDTGSRERWGGVECAVIALLVRRWGWGSGWENKQRKATVTQN